MQQVPPDEAETLIPEHDAPQLIEDGVWRIPLPLPFALRSANAYLLGEAGDWALVDCGLGTPEGERALSAGFAAAEVAPHQLRMLVLTHAHPDHIGLAEPVQTASGAPVRLLADEADRLFRVWGDPALTALHLSHAMYAANGMPAADLERIARGDAAVRKALRLPAARTVVPIVDGERLRIAGHTYQAIWTPGHSDYHVCLLREDGLFIAGDHVLPRITPNIGLYPNARPNPLDDYREALARVRDLPVRLVLPGHGLPFANLAGRVDELLAHHAERATRTLAVLAAHPEGADAVAIASDLFGERLRSADDRRFALVETLAHLDALRAQGRVERSERAGRYRYAPVAVHADA